MQEILDNICRQREAPHDSNKYFLSLLISPLNTAPHLFSLSHTIRHDQFHTSEVWWGGGFGKTVKERLMGKKGLSC